MDLQRRRELRASTSCLEAELAKSRAILDDADAGLREVLVHQIRLELVTWRVQRAMKAAQRSKTSARDWTGEDA